MSSWLTMLLALKSAVCLLALQRQGLGQHPVLVINELYYNPGKLLPAIKAKLRDTQKGEWVELYNSSNESIELGGYSLDGGICFTFPNISLESNGYVVVAKDPQAFLILYPQFDGVLLGPYKGRLNNSGDSINLTNSNGEILSELSYTDEQAWTVAPDGLGSSLELRNPKYDHNWPGSWNASIEDKGTPGRENSCWVTAIGDSRPPYISWANANTNTTGDRIRISAKIEANANIRISKCLIQIVDASNYISYKDPRYLTNWKALDLIHQGEHYVAVIDAAPQKTLLRWRIYITDEFGREAWFPAQDDPVPNEALFVDKENKADKHRSNHGAFPALPIYFLLTARNHIHEAFSRSIGIGPWPCTFIHEGSVYDHVQFGIRGDSTRYDLPKRSIKISFHKHRKFPGATLDSVTYPTKRLNLNRAVEYFGLNEAVSYKIYEQCGITVPRAHFVELRVPHSKDDSCCLGESFGLFLDVEHVDKPFLLSRGIDAECLYKMAGVPTLKMKSRTSTDSGLGEVSNTSSDKSSWIRNSVDIDKCLRFRAASKLTENYDLGNRNYYLLKRANDKKWELIPNDLNATFGVKRVAEGDCLSGRACMEFHDSCNAVKELMRGQLIREDVLTLIDDLANTIGQIAPIEIERWTLSEKIRRCSSPEIAAMVLKRALAKSLALPDWATKIDKEALCTRD